MDFGREWVEENVVRGTPWVGQNPSFNELYLLRTVALWIASLFWFLGFKLLYVIVDALSFRFFGRYKLLNKMQRVDWSSRVVAMFLIGWTVIMTVRIALEGDAHELIAIPTSLEGDSLRHYYKDWDATDWKLSKELSDKTLFLMFHYFAFLQGYELYDLKNCLDIKMMSGVIHHLVLLVVFPLIWSVTAMSSLGVLMTGLVYLTNVPAHIRSFMAHTGHRDTPLYKFNKWVWWVSYVVFRLFGIPWFSSQMWMKIPVARTQAPLFLIASYFSACIVHYALSLYWFVEMTRTMFPPSPQMVRAGSYPILPKDGKLKDKASDSEDEGGQHFD
ncbi:TLC domain-containing protein [Balamuthia mandrillaris]